MQAAAHPATAAAGTAPETGRTARDVVRIALFLLALVTPLSAMILHLGGGPQLAENRRLAERPKLTLSPKQLASYPGQMRWYFADHFGFRGSLIHLNGLLSLGLFDVPSNRDITVGKDGWFFLAGEQSTACYRNTDLFSDAELEAWARALEQRRRWLAAQGAAYLFVVAPDKETIYPEEMPELLTRVTPTSRLDQLVNAVRTRTGVTLIDVRDTLRAAKATDRLYHKTDTHWNDRGAFLAYQELMAAVAKVAPGVHLLTRDDFVSVERVTNGMDLTAQLGLSDVYPERRLELQPKHALAYHKVDQNDTKPIHVPARDGTRPSAVVFRDSFFTYLIPWLADSFGEGMYLWQDDLDPAIIEQVHPRVVIQEIAERKLMRIQPDNPAVVAAASP